MAHATTATIRADDPIFAIDDATRAGMHLLIQLYGPSQCGKTVTGSRSSSGSPTATAN